MRKLILTLILAAGAAVGAQAQLLYKVSGNGLERPSYMFGTHHMAPLAMVDSVKGTRQALQDADRVVGEIDMTVGQMALAAKLQPMMLAPSDSTLTRLIGAEKMAGLEKEFANWTPSVSPGIGVQLANSFSSPAIFSAPMRRVRVLSEGASIMG